MTDKEGLNVYCYKCTRYVGTIRNAKLMKNLSYICPKCLEIENQYTITEDEDIPGKAAYNSLLQRIFNPKKSK